MRFAQDTLYVTDLDGTLLGDVPRIPDRAVDMLNEMLDAGLPFTVATARSWVSAAPILAPLRLTQPLVLYNGAHIVSPADGRMLECCSLTRAQMERVWEACRRAGVCARFESMIDGACRMSWYAPMADEGLKAYLAPRQGDARLRPVEDEARLLDGEPFQCGALGRYEALRPLCDELEAMDFLSASLIADTYDPEWYWLTCCRFDATKACGVDKLRRLTGKARIVCFGDNLNDLPMFAVADEAYAVDNAMHRVKAAATGVIAANTDLGVPRFLRGRAVDSRRGPARCAGGEPECAASDPDGAKNLQFFG